MALTIFALLLIPSLIVALPPNPYMDATTLYSSSSWQSLVKAASTVGTPVAASPSLSFLASTIKYYSDAIWITRQDDANAMTAKLAAASTMPTPVAVTFVVYFMYERDCGGPSAGGAPDLPTYQTFINTILTAAKAYPSIRISLILEPDSVAFYTTNGCIAAASYQNYMSSAIGILSGSANIYIYLDIGNSGWTAGNPTKLAADISTILNAASSVARVRGFCTNVSNYNTIAQEVIFIQKILAALKAPYNTMKFVTDTSRNGVNPPRVAGEWCNILGASLGLKPQASPTGYSSILDAVLWIKTPGQSDGPSPQSWSPIVPSSCTGPNSAPNAPAPGDFFGAFFTMLLQNAITYSAGPMIGAALPVALSTINPFEGSTLYSSSNWASLTAKAKADGTVIANSPSKVALVDKMSAYADSTWISSAGSGIVTMDKVLASAISSRSPTTVTFVVNYIPNGGCNVGTGAATLPAYQSFLKLLLNEALLYPSVRIVFILEPNAVANMATGACTSNNALYKASLQAAVTTLSSAPNVAIYIDIGNSQYTLWNIPELVTAIYTIVGSSASVHGCSTNVASYNVLSGPNGEYEFIQHVQSAMAGIGLPRLKFVSDTSRNGLATGSIAGEWCNLNNAAFGLPPMASPAGYPLLDAVLYIKTAGESDGYSEAIVATPKAGGCTGPNSMLGAPNQGQWFAAYFAMLVSNSIDKHVGPMKGDVESVSGANAAPTGTIALCGIALALLGLAILHIESPHQNTEFNELQTSRADGDTDREEDQIQMTRSPQHGEFL